MSRGQDLLVKYIDILFTNEEKIINSRPPFLCGLEYDIYFPRLKSAFEFNGDQHYVDTATFGSCSSQVDRDKKKVTLSRKNHIRLFRIDACHLNKERILGFLYRAGFKNVRKVMEQNASAISRLDSESAQYRYDLRLSHPEVTTIYNPRNRSRMIADVLAGRYDRQGYQPGSKKNWER